MAREKALDVSEANRGRGIGTALIRVVEQIAVNRGLSRANLEVCTQYRRAGRLYERLGYRLAEGPMEDSWQVHLDDGATITERELAWVMVK